MTDPHPDVDAYIDRLPVWQQDVCRWLRSAGLVNQGHGNATARAIQVYEGDRLDRDALVALLRAIVANNRAGGWRRLSRSTS